MGPVLHDRDDLAWIDTGKRPDTRDPRLVGTGSISTVLAEIIPPVARLAAPGGIAFFLGIGSWPSGVRVRRLFSTNYGKPLVVEPAATGDPCLTGS
jgi:hypothetical protein